MSSIINRAALINKCFWDFIPVPYSVVSSLGLKQSGGCRCRTPQGGLQHPIHQGFSKEEIAEAIEKQAAIKAMTAPIPVKKMEDLVKKTAPYNKLIDRSSENFKDSPWLNRWADKKDLQSVAHAYAQAGDTVQLQEKVDTARKEASGIQASIVEIDKKLRALKELAVSVRSYQDSKKYADAYKKTKNKEKFYENHEAQLIIFNAAEREIKAIGLNPAKVTYEQVIEGIEKLNIQKKSVQAEYKSLSKALSEKEQQLEMIREYMRQKDINSHEHTIVQHMRKRREQL